MTELQTHMVNTGSIAFMHCMKEQTPPQNRSSTKHMADVVFDLETQVRGSELENRLTVPKFRGGTALKESIKLELADEVAIDTSRDIA